jgi:hypothetical protein
VDIGTFKTFYIDVEGAVAEGESVFDVFDSRHETVGYYEDLYDDDGADFRPEIVKAACGRDYLWGPNLLILDRLILEPAYRGKCRGLMALRGLIELLRPGAGLVAMKPFPLQKESHFLSEHARDERARLQLDGFPSNRRVATSALRRYYRRLGFSSVPSSEYMVLDPKRALKSVAEIQNPSFVKRQS